MRRGDEAFAALAVIVSALDPATRALVGVAAHLYASSEGALADMMREAREAGTPAAWLEELVLSAVLFAGFPRALVAAAALRQVEPQAGDAGDAADYSRWRDWQERGEETCRRIYGSNYDKLRRNVLALHPALDAWIVVDGYGRTISRPALDLKRRELCSIAVLVPQGVPRQLHSHLRGALNAGASHEEVEETLEIIDDAVGVLPTMMTGARRLWDEVRST